MLDSTERKNKNFEVEVNQKFIQNNRDIEKYLNEQISNLKRELFEERKKNDTILSGKCHGYTVEAEGRILNKVTATLNQNHLLKEEIFKKMEIQSSDLDDKLRHF